MSEPLVHIATAPNEPIAMMWKEILEEEGIHSIIKGEDLTAAMYIPSGLFQCRIHVLASQAEKAKQILASFLDEGGG
jgi:hypothetical protein